jgi:hypothetical protein
MQLFSYCFHSLSISISAITIFAFLFNKYLWKIPVFKNWLVLVPNLNGKWQGSISSNWFNQKFKQIETSLSIKQSLSYISCVMTTEEMKSHSITANFKIDTTNQEFKLLYIYKSEPDLNVRKKSPIHYGTIIFDIVKLEKCKIRLKGNYWTDRESNGTIILDKI